MGLKPKSFLALKPTLQELFVALKTPLPGVEAWEFDLSSVDQAPQDVLRDYQELLAFTLRKVQALYQQVDSPTKSRPTVALMTDILYFVDPDNNDLVDVDNEVRGRAAREIKQALIEILGVSGHEDIWLE